METSPLLHPRGPLPPAVYWRRRMLTLLVVALVLFLVARSCTGGGSTPAAHSSPSPTARPSVTPSRTASPSASASPPVAAVGPCPGSVLLVQATAGARSYPAGVSPVFTLSVRNTGDVSCTRDVGAAAQELHVTSGNDRIWSSDDCSPGRGSQVVTLKAGETRTFRTVWQRRRSYPGCPSGTPAAAPGTYRVLGALGDLSANSATFTLA